MDLIESIKDYFNDGVKSQNPFLKSLPVLKEVKELGKGLANINFLLSFDESRYFVMRFNIWPDQVWYNGNVTSIDNEYQVLKLLEPYNIGPKVYFLDTTKARFPFEFLIEEYIEHDGKKANEDFRGVTESVKKLHSIDISKLASIRVDASVNQKIELYDLWVSQIISNNTASVARIFLEYADIYKKYIQDNEELLVGTQLIHRDLFPENLLHQGHTWYLIDWQTAVIGNPIQDITYLLWDFIYQYTLKRPLSNEEKQVIITTYFGEDADISSVLSKTSKLLPIFYIDLFLWLLYKEQSFKKQAFEPDLKDFLWSRIAAANDMILNEEQIKYWFSKMK